MVPSQRNVRRNLGRHWVYTRKILEVRKAIGPRKREAYKVRAMRLSNRFGRRNDAEVLSNLQTYVVRIASIKRIRLGKPTQRVH